MERQGRHEQLRPTPGTTGSPGFWGTFRSIMTMPPGFLLGLLALLIGFAVLAVQLENHYGGLWGALVASGLAPLAGSALLRARMTRHRR